MKYHIALSNCYDLETINKTFQEKKCPSHIIWEMSQLLKAKIHQPEGNPILPIDVIRAKIIGRPEYWALARKLSSQLQDSDTIYCDGEHVGIAIATVCGKLRARPKIVVFCHNINRPRGRLALKLFNIANRVDLFVTYASSQTEFLRNYLRLKDNRIYQLSAAIPIDTSFFTPGKASNKVRPVIGSGGLEKRDYITLANATKDLDVDVKICAFSRNAKQLKQTFPDVIPSNMSYGFYDWPDLVQLYRDSDIVVITLYENNYQAGLTTLFEAMACGRPVIITRSSGIIGELIDSDMVTGVAPGDADGVKQAIEKLLNNPCRAIEQATRGYELVVNSLNHTKYVNDLGTKLISKFGNPLII